MKKGSAFWQCRPCFASSTPGNPGARKKDREITRLVEAAPGAKCANGSTTGFSPWRMVRAGPCRGGAQGCPCPEPACGPGGSVAPLFVRPGCALRIPGVPRFPASVHVWPECLAAGRDAFGRLLPVYARARRKGPPLRATGHGACAYFSGHFSPFTGAQQARTDSFPQHICRVVFPKNPFLLGGFFLETQFAWFLHTSIRKMAAPLAS